MKTATLTNGEIVLQFPYDEATLDRVRAIPGRRFRPTSKDWVVPLTPESAGPLRRELTDPANWWEAPADVLAEFDRAAARWERAESGSSALASSFEVGGLGMTLRPFQRAGVEYATARPATLIADEMGLGKTLQALAALQARDSFPAIVVCPLSVRLHWLAEARRALPGRSVALLDGPEGVDGPADIQITTYEKLSKGLVSVGNHVWSSPLVEALRGAGVRGLIVDECHRVKNAKSQRSRAVRALARGTETKLLLTGTPIVNRASDLLHLLQILGVLGQFGGFWTFAERYCGAHKGPYGWDFSRSTNTDELHSRLRSIAFLRREKADVLADLPAKSRALVPLEPARDFWARYSEAETDLVRFLAGNSPESLAGAMYAETLARMATLKRLCVEGKAEAALNWINGFLEDTDEKLVLFAVSRRVVEGFAEYYGVPVIHGGIPEDERQAAVRRFQTDPACRLIVLNLQTGSLGLTLTAASHVAFLEFGWTAAEHDQAEDRCHRIGQTESVNVYYLTLGGTIETEILSLVDKKRTIAGEIVSGTSAETNAVSALVRKFRSRSQTP